MPDPAERFITAATAPLGDNAELQMMAEQELRDALASAQARPGSDSLDVAAENLETAWPWKRWKAVLYGLAAVTAVLAAIPVAQDSMRYRLATHALYAMGNSESFGLPRPPLIADARARVPELFGKHTPAQRLLLFGDVSKPTESERFKALWDSDPSDPALFAEFFRAAVRESPSLPKLLQTADRLDPENAWYRYMAAAAAARGAVGTNPPRHRSAGVPHSSRYRIKDPARLAEALKLFDEANRMQRFDTHEDDLLLRRLELLPAGNDVLGRKLTESYLSMEPRNPDWIYRAIADAVAAQAEELALKGDSGAFIALVESWELFVRRSVESAGVFSGDVQAPLSDFHDTGKSIASDARTLGLEDLSRRFESLTRKLHWDRLVHSERADELERLSRKAGRNSLHILKGRAALASPPPLAESELEPGRMAEHAMRARVGTAIAGAVLLLVLLLTAATRLPRGFQVRRLSHALVKVLRPADYRWILIGGVVAPVLVHLLFDQVSATVELRPWEAASLRHFTLAGALLTMPALIAARQLGRRLGGLGWDRPPGTFVSAAVAGFSVAWIAGSVDADAARLVGWAIVATIPFISFLILPFGAFITPRDTAVRWQVYCRAMLPAQVLALLLMALLIPVHHARERHWTALNTLTRIEAGVPSMNRYDHEIARRMRLELLEIFDRKP